MACRLASTHPVLNTHQQCRSHCANHNRTAAGTAQLVPVLSLLLVPARLPNTCDQELGIPKLLADHMLNRPGAAAASLCTERGGHT
jgi:hypothetical protein